MFRSWRFLHEIMAMTIVQYLWYSKFSDRGPLGGCALLHIIHLSTVEEEEGLASFPDDITRTRSARLANSSLKHTKQRS
jgi:hypothetical protein